MKSRDQLEAELELAEHTLRGVRDNPHDGPGWTVIRRAGIYAAEAEIKRLKSELDMLR